MAWLDGKFNRLFSWKIEAQNNENISALKMDQDTNDIANGISQCITNNPDKGGVPQDHMDWNNKRLTNLADGVNSKDAVTMGQMLTGVGILVDLSTTVNLIYIPIPLNTIFKHGTRILILCNNTNSSDATAPGAEKGKVYITDGVKTWTVLNMDRLPNTILQSGTIKAGSFREFIYTTTPDGSSSAWCLMERTADVANVDLSNVTEVGNDGNVANKSLTNIDWVDETTEGAHRTLSNVMLDGSERVAKRDLSNIQFDNDTTGYAKRALKDIWWEPNTEVAKRDLSNVTGGGVADHIVSSIEGGSGTSGLQIYGTKSKKGYIHIFIRIDNSTFNADNRDITVDFYNWLGLEFINQYYFNSAILVYNNAAPSIDYNIYPYYVRQRGRTSRYMIYRAETTRPSDVETTLRSSVDWQIELYGKSK
ncbi:hypothetical protein AGMMS49995_11050 [Endomicrobiia bacterium]|nr:hypothetical protein AGMMS49995_11050 [Endomicrobiia bacterium]